MMKNIFYSIFILIAVSIIISCSKEDNNDILFPVTYKMDTSKVDMSEINCFAVENDQLIEANSFCSPQLNKYNLIFQKIYLYEYGYLSSITLLNETQAEVISFDEDGNTTTTSFEYSLVDGKLTFDTQSSLYFFIP